MYIRMQEVRYLNNASLMYILAISQRSCICLFSIEAPVQVRDRCYSSCRVLASVQRGSLTFQSTSTPLLQSPTHSILGTIIATLDPLRVARDPQRIPDNQAEPEPELRFLV
jgi:hypothetical protein